ncbi:MAG: electron transfer flavoprotein subunit beta/FixA family protein [Flavobacteriaceae bacterium]|jgi:electron transfer flavoprotein beta subunit
MKILVCISCVPDTTSKINFTENDTQFDKNGVQFVINPNDEFGLTRAMWIKEKDNSSIDVINVGLQDTEPILRKTLAIGADKAIRINSDPKDSFQVAKLIVDFVSKNNYDLIIAGRESIDFNGNMVPGIISELLGINFITNCVGLDITNNKVTAKREIEGGTETLTFDLPAVIGGQKGLVEESDLKIPNMRGIMQARQKPLDVIEVDENNINTETIKFYKPQEKGEIKMIDPDNLDELIKLLHNEAKVI